jgi:hypothetical protein
MLIAQTILITPNFVTTVPKSYLLCNFGDKKRDDYDTSLIKYPNPTLRLDGRAFVTCWFAGRELRDQKWSRLCK